MAVQMRKRIDVLSNRGLTPFAQRLQAEHDRRRAKVRAELLRNIVGFVVPYLTIIACLLFWGLLNGLIGGM